MRRRNRPSLPGSARENIAFGDETAADAAIIAAAERAEAWAFLEKKGGA